MSIGGIFCLESPDQEGQNCLDILGGTDLRLCMSGRCAIYYCLLDLKLQDEKQVAYLPAYTCETVIAPYKKAGYTLRFYDISPEGLTPQFNRDLIPHISVLGLCGYYGFSSYDQTFVQACVDAGVRVIQDITHSVFSADGINPLAQYTVGSLRKWLGIPSGGIAVKRRGTFSLPLLPVEEVHIQGRRACFEAQAQVLRGETGATEEGARKIFWETELRLRRIFDAYQGDSLSQDIIIRYPYLELIRRRQENYRFILSQAPFNPLAVPVFPVLEEGVCPSHFSLYASDRERVRETLTQEGITATVYWPFHGDLDIGLFPGAAYIYDHIYSVPVDQRYTTQEMTLLCKVLDSLKTQGGLQK